MTDMIAHHKEQRAEQREERDAARWLLAIDVRDQRKAREAQQAEWAEEDSDPDYQSTRRMWEAITHPDRFVRRVKTAAQIERETECKARAAANLLIHDPMLWR
jgi:ferric-dicitrate binding protein FerR (iron transport regulator)